MVLECFVYSPLVYSPLHKKSPTNGLQVTNCLELPNNSFIIRSIENFGRKIHSSFTRSEIFAKNSVITHYRSYNSVTRPSQPVSFSDVPDSLVASVRTIHYFGWNAEQAGRAESGQFCLFDDESGPLTVMDGEKNY